MCELCRHTPCLTNCPNYVPPVVCLCWKCGEEIYEGDTIYEINEEIWCENCVDDCRSEAELYIPEPDYDD